MLSDDVLTTWWSYRLEKPFAKTIELYGSRPRVISDLIFSILSYIFPARSIMLSMKLTGIYTGSHAICKNIHIRGVWGSSNQITKHKRQ